MNERAKLLLEMILSHDNITQQQAAIFLGVSDRTVRNTLDEIDEYLIAHNLNSLEKNTKTFLSYNGDHNSIRALAIEENTNNNNLLINPDYRMEFIYYSILTNKSRVTIDFLEKICQASRSTINNDVRRLKTVISKEGIHLEFSKKKGFFLTGDESAIRNRYINTSRFIRQRIPIISPFSEVEEELIRFCLDQIEQSLHIKFTYESFLQISDYLCISIIRLLESNTIIKVAKIDDIEFDEVRKTLSLLESFFNIRFSTIEVSELLNAINRSHLLKNELIDKRLNLKLDILAGKFVDKITKKLKINFLEDSDFINNLTLHFQTVINQVPLPNNDTISDEMMIQIKSKYNEVFDVISQTVDSIPRMCKLGFNTEENIYLLTIHVISGIERIKSLTEAKLRVLLVCHMGVGTSQLLQIKLSKIFNFKCKVASIEDISDVKKINENYDLVLSTVNLHNSKMNYVKVSPYITDNELKQLSEFIASKTRDLMREEFNKSYKELRIPVLKELLTENNIRVNVPVENWEDAIKKSGNILLNNGSIENEYIEGMINVVKEFGSYIVILPGIALAHASTNDGVNRIGMSLITLENDVKFGNKKNDPVHTVICLATIDHDTHLKALSELVALLNDDDFKMKLKNNEKKKIINSIQKVKIESNGDKQHEK
ncbi:BglG family transcription antiterminator [Companilactobacillus sp. FL22-1]|uniref:BglG family transcription antiterminator n=1 Tax=Companilactobacillus sp. FL22-1 TaxID=3373892 RepID=UPI0037550C65